MDTTATTSQPKDDARRLLGTLSTHPGDIDAAFTHQYQHTLQQLRQVQSDDEQDALEKTLRSLRLARKQLLETNTVSQPPAAAGTAPTATLASGQQQPAVTPHTLLVISLALLFTLLAGSGGWFVSHLQQQIVQLQLISEEQTQQLLRMQDIHLGERRQWLAQQDLQQRQIIRQQEAIGQQHQQYSALQHQLAQSEQQRVQLDASNRQQQQHIQHLNRVSDQLISSLCDDSANLSPAVGSHLRAAYLQRCSSSWRLAAQ